MFHVDLSPFGVDVERLKSDRLSRLQGIMRARDLSALLLTDPLNIRYATNTVLWLNLRATGVQRFALVPADGEPVVYERLMGSERAAGLKKAGRSGASGPTCSACGRRWPPSTSSTSWRTGWRTWASTGSASASTRCASPRWNSCGTRGLRW